MGTGKIRERLYKATHGGKLVTESELAFFDLCDGICDQLDDLWLKTSLLEQHTGLLLEQHVGSLRDQDRGEPERDLSEYGYGIKPVVPVTDDTYRWQFTDFSEAKGAAEVLAQKTNGGVLVFKIIGEFSPEVRWYGPENY